MAGMWRRTGAGGHSEDVPEVTPRVLVGLFISGALAIALMLVLTSPVMYSTFDGSFSPEKAADYLLQLPGRVPRQLPVSTPTP